MIISENIILWCNSNSGFLSLLLFTISIILGIISGFFKSIIRKPRLKIRIIDKMTFYSFYYTGENYYNKQLNENFKYHKTGFVLYLSIANVGNQNTSIDKIWLGYKKNYNKSKLFRKNKYQWLAQSNIVNNFEIKFNDVNSLTINNLRLKNDVFDNSAHSSLDVGNSMVGIAYFEQESAWGNLNPKPNKDHSTDVILKIKDINDKNYKFKINLKQIPIDEARKYNEDFGDFESIFRGKRA